MCVSSKNEIVLTIPPHPLPAFSPSNIFSRIDGGGGGRGLVLGVLCARQCPARDFLFF